MHAACRRAQQQPWVSARPHLQPCRVDGDAVRLLAKALAQLAAALSIVPQPHRSVGAAGCHQRPPHAQVEASHGCMAAADAAAAARQSSDEKTTLVGPGWTAAAPAPACSLQPAAARTPPQGCASCSRCMPSCTCMAPRQPDVWPPAPSGSKFMPSAARSSWLCSASVNAAPPPRLSASCSSFREIARLLRGARRGSARERHESGSTWALLMRDPLPMPTCKPGSACCGPACAHARHVAACRQTRT